MAHASLPIFLLGRSVCDLLASKIHMYHEHGLTYISLENQPIARQTKQRYSCIPRAQCEAHRAGIDVRNGNDIPWRRNFSNRVTFQMWLLGRGLGYRQKLAQGRQPPVYSNFIMV